MHKRLCFVVFSDFYTAVSGVKAVFSTHRPQHLLLLSGLHTGPVPTTTPSLPAQGPLPQRILQGLSKEK